MTDSILDEIFSRALSLVASRKAETPLPQLMRRARLAPEPADFAGALRGGQNGAPRVIAELKKASPSAGTIRADFEPVKLARALESAGAAALSVLTEPHYFQGSPRYLEEVARAVALPLLRKDFICDPYQVCEARAWGASAVLLIAASLDAKKLRELRECAEDFGMAALCEAHTAEELERALESGARVAGVNCRDLRTFHVDPERTASLLGKIPESVVRVAESGVKSRADIDALLSRGADAFLIGTTLMRAASPADALKTLIG